MEFCPVCNSLLYYGTDSSENKLELQCQQCGFYKYSTADQPIQSKYIVTSSKQNNEYSLPTNITRFDKTMTRTSIIDCQNEECPSLNLESWLENTKNVPNVLMFNNPDQNKIMYFLCTVCNSSWHTGQNITPTKIKFKIAQSQRQIALDKSRLGFKDAITLTFSEVVENHAGNQQISIYGYENGKAIQAEEGFSVEELDSIAENLDSTKYGYDLYDLRKLLPADLQDDADEAKLLVIHNGINMILESDTATNKLKAEHDRLLANKIVDKKYFDPRTRKVKNKIARWNLCFTNKNQEPDYNNKKGRLLKLSDPKVKDQPISLKYTQRIRNALPDFFGDKAKDLFAEGNYYYDKKKCSIGYHGDKERKIVIGLRLGAVFPLHYQWFLKNKEVTGSRELSVRLGHGDLYIMSNKATGNDFKKFNILTLRHAAKIN